MMQQGYQCPTCRSPIQYGQNVCSTCGNLLSSRCPSCGAGLNPGAPYCSACGAKFGRPNSSQQQYSPPNPGWNYQQQPPYSGAPQYGSGYGYGYKKPSWTSNPMVMQLTSRRSLLLMVLLVLIIGMVSFVVCQFTPKSNKGLPVISGVLVPFRGKSSAQITWQTDRPCSSQVEYGRTTQYGYLQPMYPDNDPSTGKSTGLTSHNINLNQLRAGSTYHYRIRSKDSAGNEGISNDFSFKTDDEAPFVVPD
jgi:hypothetical protein